jgi:hypothetical protein
MDGVPDGHTTDFQQGVTRCVKDFRRGKGLAFLLGFVWRTYCRTCWDQRIQSGRCRRGDPANLKLN